MSTTNYITERDSIINAFSKSFPIWENEDLLGKFNLVSAGLSNYLPGIDFKNHEPIFRNILLHQKLSILEQSQKEALNWLTCENFTPEKLNLLQKGGNIICTFHSGSYRIINQLLVQQEIPFTLVINSTVIQREGEAFSNLHKSLSSNAPENSFGIIDAESPSSGLQMLRAIKNKHNLVLYIDGNMGSGQQNEEKNNLCDIQFLQQRIFARKGIAFLAHVAKAPIIPVACFRKSFDDIRLKFFETIYPDGNENRDSFATNTTQKIYHLLEPIIKEYPEQWEAWMYLHREANIVTHDQVIYPSTSTDCSNANRWILNQKEYGVFRLDRETYLFKKATYDSYTIDHQIYSLLHSTFLNPVHKKDIEASLFSELYQNRVLIPE